MARRLSCQRCPEVGCGTIARADWRKVSFLRQREGGVAIRPLRTAPDRTVLITLLADNRPLEHSRAVNWTKILALLVSLSMMVALTLGFEIASAATPAPLAHSAITDPCTSMPSGHQDKAMVAKCCAVGCIAIAAHPRAPELPSLNGVSLFAAAPASFVGLVADVETPPPRAV